MVVVGVIVAADEEDGGGSRVLGWGLIASADRGATEGIL